MPQLIDLADRNFGHWIVVERVANKGPAHPYWRCRCKCGCEREVGGYALRSGTSKSCGCSQKTSRQCSVANCDRKHLAKGLCRLHYLRVYANGTLEKVRKPSDPGERIRRHFTVHENGCWLWHGYVDARGYAKFQLDGRMQWAHRVSYLLSKGPIPKGLTLDHLCRTPSCVNPDHLEIVTRAENQRRAARREFCPKGHPLSDDNLAPYKLRKGHRLCLQCARAACRDRHHRLREAGGRYSKTDVERLHQKQKGRCGYCRKRLGKNGQVDHIQPVKRGGGNWPRNLQLLCRHCNILKRDQDPAVFAVKFGDGA
ncbi:MAG: HNH endonuclease [Methyloceanibacter sp.]